MDGSGHRRCLQLIGLGEAQTPIPCRDTQQERAPVDPLDVISLNNSPLNETMLGQ